MRDTKGRTPLAPPVLGLGLGLLLLPLCSPRSPFPRGLGTHPMPKTTPGFFVPWNPIEEEELRPRRGRREYSVCSFYPLIRWPLDKG
ncbi:hypothetical protein M758_6G205600 [Ceratodon purpureus]|nr:hypothetical protein M758_6G205600 [Ceratodon purpureus]